VQIAILVESEKNLLESTVMKTLRAQVLRHQTVRVVMAESNSLRG
jgi:hypothetical protein